MNGRNTRQVQLCRRGAHHLGRAADAKSMTNHARPRRGCRRSLGNGLRHDHTVTCTVAGTPEGCTCPYSFWQPRSCPRKRVTVFGTLQEVLALRDHMRREASPAIYLPTFTPHAVAHATQPAATPAPQPVASTPTFGEWAQQVRDTVWLRHSASTRANRGRVYKLLVEPDLAHVDLHDVTAQFIEQWLADMTNRGVTLHMQRQAYDIVRTILKVWYEQAGQPNPAATVKRPICPPSQERRAKDCTLTAEQYQRVIAACTTAAEELLMRLATEASLRVGEICGLQRRDVDIAARTITIKRQGNRNTTKTGHARVITIVTKDLATCLARHLADMDAAGYTRGDHHILQGGHHPSPHTNRPYERQGPYRIMRRILTRVGLEEATRPHGLRATGAKLLIEAGASMELVSQHLGHATIRTTEDYYVGKISTGGMAGYGDAFG